MSSVRRQLVCFTDGCREAGWQDVLAFGTASHVTDKLKHQHKREERHSPDNDCHDDPIDGGSE